MALELRSVHADEVAAFQEAMFHTFGFDPEVDPDFPRRFEALLGPTRAWVVVDGATIVATAGTFELEVGLPGGASLPIAGLTTVTVRPTHRRRGLLRLLMDRHLEDARARGRGVSGLWASEASIYGRFGYGIAAFGDAVEVSHGHDLALAPGAPVDAVEPADEARARALLPPIYARVTADRPGALRRTEAWWRERRFTESPWARGGASRRRHVIARRGDEAVGYLVYRQRGGVTDNLPSGRTEINELLALDARAATTLWRYALSLDLFPTVAWWNAPVDDPLAWLATDPRRPIKKRGDTLWLRIEDVPGALTARDYTCDGALTLDVEGTTWALRSEAGHATCVPTSSPPDLVLPRAALGALYLGGTPASALAHAGVITGTPAALALADRLFASPRAPWCPEVF